MSLVRVTVHKGRIDRVREGVTPVVEIHLEENQRVVQVELIDRTAWVGGLNRRKTHDWAWTAYVETRL